MTAIVRNKSSNISFLTHAELSSDSLNFIQDKIDLFKKYHSIDFLMAIEVLNELDGYLKNIQKSAEDSYEIYLDTFIAEVRKHKEQLYKIIYINYDKTFIKSLSYIMANGSFELKSRNDCQNVIKIRLSHQTALKALIPDKLKKPLFLHRGHNFRYHFFKDIHKKILIEKLLHISFEKNSIHEFLDNINEIRQLLLSQLTLTESQVTRGFLSIFRRQSNQLVLAWKNILTDQQKLLQTYQQKAIEFITIKNQTDSPDINLNFSQENHVQATFNRVLQYYKIPASEREMFILKNHDMIQAVNCIVLNFLNDQPEKNSSLSSEPFIMWIEQCGQLIQQYHDDQLTHLREQAAEHFLERYQNYLTGRPNCLSENNFLLIRLELLVEKIVSHENARKLNHLKMIREFLIEGKPLASIDVLIGLTNKTESDTKTNTEDSLTQAKTLLQQAQARLEKSKTLLARNYIKSASDENDDVNTKTHNYINPQPL